MHEPLVSEAPFEGTVTCSEIGTGAHAGTEGVPETRSDRMTGRRTLIADNDRIVRIGSLDGGELETFN
jgi:hypothetical protein